MNAKKDQQIYEKILSRIQDELNAQVISINKLMDACAALEDKDQDDLIKELAIQFIVLAHMNNGFQFMKKILESPENESKSSS